MSLPEARRGSLRDVLLNEVMPEVERPSRYLGTELNSVHKNPENVELRLALAFPDLYDLGLGNLGLLILYRILNDLSWCWAERAYAPWLDMEARLRARSLPLFTAESKTPLRELDGVGFTLQSELTYTNILNMIDLAGIPLRADRRGESDPLLFAGGPCVFNPEPLAPFMDFLVIGDGEDAVRDIADTMRATRDAPRSERLQALAGVPGVYVPALYPFETLDDGRVLPRLDAPKIVRRAVSNLDTAPWPSELVVPFTQQVHDRAGLEVLRGCTQGCRFCQAGMTTRPVRERDLDTVDRLMTETLAATGYDEVSLVSLSTCDHSHVAALVRRAAERGARSSVSVSLPSLRIDSFAVELADMLADVRRSSMTFAPEAATPRLRAVINKWIPDEDLLRVACEAYRRGWGHIKTYFMIGLPTEQDDDVHAIVDLCVRTLKAGRAVTSRARLNTGVSIFVPRAFTPFQWAAQLDLDESIRRQRLLDEGFARHRGIKFGKHNPVCSLIEGLIARSDRRCADLIEAAWRRGARFDAWDDQVRLRTWLDAVAEVGFSIGDALRERDPRERLPWDHIDVLIPKAWFEEDWRRALEGRDTGDCRRGSCRQCGINAREPSLCADMWRRFESEDETPTPSGAKPWVAREEPPKAQRLRLRIGREGEARFLSHLELMTAWVRALRRAEAPLSYSQGFHAHPKVTFASAPPVGEESVGDYMDIVLFENVEPQALLERIRRKLPLGLLALEISEVPLNAPALMATVAGYTYRLECDRAPDALDERIRAVNQAQTLPVQRSNRKPKGGGRGAPAPSTEIDLRPMLRLVTRHADTGDRVILDVELAVLDGRSARIREVLALLGLDPVVTRSTKLATHFH